jgi:hypothetical protein
VTITEAYFTAAEYTGTECKYVETYGTDLSLTVGRGEQAFSFVRSAKVCVAFTPAPVRARSSWRVIGSVQWLGDMLKNGAESVGAWCVQSGLQALWQEQKVLAACALQRCTALMAYRAFAALELLMS